MSRGQRGMDVGEKKSAAGAVDCDELRFSGQSRQKEEDKPLNDL